MSVHASDYLNGMANLNAAAGIDAIADLLWIFTLMLLLLLILFIAVPAVVDAADNFCLKNFHVLIIFGLIFCETAQ